MFNQNKEKVMACCAIVPEAVHEAEGREMRRVINFQSEMCRVEKTVAGRHEAHDRQAADRRASRRACEERKHANLQLFLTRNFGSVLLLSIVCMLDLFEVVAFEWCMIAAAVIFASWVINIFAYFTRNYKKPEKEEQAACS